MSHQAEKDKPMAGRSYIGSFAAGFWASGFWASGLGEANFPKGQGEYECTSVRPVCGMGGTHLPLLSHPATTCPRGLSPASATAVGVTTKVPTPVGDPGQTPSELRVTASNKSASPRKEK